MWSYPSFTLLHFFYSIDVALLVRPAGKLGVKLIPNTVQGPDGAVIALPATDQPHHLGMQQEVARGNARKPFDHWADPRALFQSRPHRRSTWCWLEAGELGNENLDIPRHREEARHL